MGRKERSLRFETNMPYNLRRRNGRTLTINIQGHGLVPSIKGDWDPAAKSVRKINRKEEEGGDAASPFDVCLDPLCPTVRSVVTLRRRHGFLNHMKYAKATMTRTAATAAAIMITVLSLPGSAGTLTASAVITIFSVTYSPSTVTVPASLS